ncbi:ribonuclease H-like domain-containing protein [Tanacetum coccineum]
MAEQDIPPPTIIAMKIPVIRKGEYDIWSMRMRQYICHTDHNLWDVIVHGDLEEEPAPTGETSAPLAPKTAKQLAARRNHERVKSILLLAIPEEYLLKFHNVADAKSLWKVIKSRFGGNEESKKMQKNVHGAPISKEDIKQKFLRSLPPSWNKIDLIMRNKPEIDTNDLYNNLRVYEDEMKRSSSSTSTSQNLAFLSSENTSSTNEVSTASGDFGVSTAGGISQVPSTPCAHDAACSFFAQPTTSPQLENEDFQQIDEDDLEELDLRWQVAMLTVRCYNCHRKGHFARECRSGRNQGKRSYGDNGRSNAPTNESSSQALVAQDGLGGYDWSNDFEIEPVNYALMAISSSSSSSSSDNEGYELALESLESRILGHEKNELAWGEKYEFQNYELKCREIKINNLNTELEKVVKERDELKLKIEKWEESSKNLDELLNSQMSARDKTGLEYGTQWQAIDLITGSCSGGIVFALMPYDCKNRAGVGSTRVSNLRLRNFDLEDMELESTNSGPTAKLHILKLGENLEQIHEGDLKQMDREVATSLLSVERKEVLLEDRARRFSLLVMILLYMKTKVECTTVIRLDTLPGSVENQEARKDSSEIKTTPRKQGNTKHFQGMLVIDGVKVLIGVTCQEEQKQYDDLLANNFNQTKFKASTYKRGLDIVEAQLVTYRKNEVLFSEEVVVLIRDVGIKQYEINTLKTEFEKLKQEKDGIEFKIEKFDKASKVNTVRPRINTARSYRTPINTVRPRVNTARQNRTSVNAAKANRFNVVKPSACWGKPQHDDKGFVDSGCSRHMTGIKTHLSISKEVGTPRYLSLVVPLTKVGDEAVHKELGDIMERAATTASSLEAEQDSGSGPRCQDTILGDVNAQTRFEITSIQSIDPPLSRVIPHLEVLKLVLSILVSAVKRMLMLPVQVSAIEEKPKESDGFAEIIDFLKASSVSYALTVNPIKPSKKAQRQEAEVPQDEAEHEESVPTPSNDPQPSGEDSMQLTELMVLCTKLQTQVLDLQKAKDAQAKEIAALKKRI